MALVASVTGFPELMANLQAKARVNNPPTASVNVGYTQEYAIWVHENLAATHAIGQAKYLEQPLRERTKDMKDIVVRTVDKAKRPLIDGLLLAGLFLQRESQLLCPIDTGALKGSAFTRKGSTK